jgi:hypothetical protein
VIRSQISLIPQTPCASVEPTAAKANGGDLKLKFTTFSRKENFDFNHLVKILSIFPKPPVNQNMELWPLASAARAINVHAASKDLAACFLWGNG